LRSVDTTESALNMARNEAPKRALLQRPWAQTLLDAGSSHTETPKRGWDDGSVNTDGFSKKQRSEEGDRSFECLPAHSVEQVSSSVQRRENGIRVCESAKTKEKAAEEGGTRRGSTPTLEDAPGQAIRPEVVLNEGVGEKADGGKNRQMEEQQGGDAKKEQEVQLMFESSLAHHQHVHMGAEDGEWQRGHGDDAGSSREMGLDALPAARRDENESAQANAQAYARSYSHSSKRPSDMPSDRTDMSANDSVCL